jgi:alpha/beta superfamily hydrolase
MKPRILAFAFLALLSSAFATEVKHDVIYSGPASADNPRRLDVFTPDHPAKPFPLVIWFHGGSMTAGTKNSKIDRTVAARWTAHGIGIINADYRLSPSVKFPAYVEDAAQAVAWAVREAVALGADPTAIFVSGHSAGGYLAAMLAMDEKYLRAAGLEPSQIAGYFPLSGQMTTHFTVCKERSLNNLAVIVDDAAPAHFVRATIPRLLLLIGDHDWPARLEENQFLAAQLTQVAKSKNVSFRIIADRTHTSIYEKLLTPGDAAGAAMLEFIGAH